GLALRFGRLELPEPFATHCLARLDRPTPRIRAGLALRGLASACIDVSDGLAQDLGHILSASGCGATLALGQLPLTAVSAALGAEAAWPYALAGGDDYELLFTLPAAQQAEAEARLAAAGCPFSVIGRIDPEPGLRLVRPDGRPHALERGGYEHFA
ncbi:MAG TPA: AIR synthase-related protein, partial [Plasticicumulans sp.]|nr:AIR synthase-related protein [Plasticicumulans sp.]